MCYVTKKIWRESAQGMCDACNVVTCVCNVMYEEKRASRFVHLITVTPERRVCR